MMPIRIIIDPLPEADRVAVLKDGRLVAYFEDDGPAAAPRPGSIASVRVERVFAENKMIACGLDMAGRTIPASLRWSGGAMPKPGDQLVVTVAADAREGKPIQLRRGVVHEDLAMILESREGGLRLSRRLAATGFEAPAALVDLAQKLKSEMSVTLRLGAAKLDADALTARAMRLSEEVKTLADSAASSASDGVISSGPDAATTAQHIFPDAEVMIDADGTCWQESDLDSMIEAAILPRHELAGGAVLHINTPPGAAVVDGDSGSSNLSPSALADAMVAPVAEAMLLRRISGPVVIDFPRLDRAGQERIDTAMRQAVADDPLHPVCHGFTLGGLYTLTRPWRWRPLADLRAPTPQRLGLAALRLARQAGMAAKTGVVVVPPAVGGWLNGDGAAYRDTIMKGLASRVEFRSDEGCAETRFDPQVMKG